MAFSLSTYPWTHKLWYDGSQWFGDFVKEDDLLPGFSSKGNPPLSLVNYTTQYGLGCFEGLKAFPQPDGSLKLFRPDQNCARMARSMKGLLMPPVDEKLLLDSIIELVRRNSTFEIIPQYEKEWEKDNWQTADTVYIRPFTYSEPGIGINLSKKPWIFTVCTTVSSYFTLGKNNAIVTKRIRATPNGTGWIKTAANYVTSLLAKTEAMEAGYMEAVFLDSETRLCIEEGSSCNFFAVFPGPRVVTPKLNDTILPGITRDSVITLIKERGIDISIEDLPLEKVLNEAEECFATGTAVGITPLSSLTHENRTRDLSSMKESSLSQTLLKDLKSIQFGAIKDTYNWMTPL